MSMLGRARARLRSIVRRGRLEREMQHEMTAHIAQAAERLIAGGMSEAEALAAARREFGHLATLQESARDARGGRWADDLRADLKYALRSFGRIPLATVTIVLTLGLGVGFSSAVFSVLNGIFNRPAPGVPNDGALVKIRGLSSASPSGRSVSHPELAAYAALHETFAAVAGWTTSGVVVGVGDDRYGTLSANTQFVTPNYFNTLGVRIRLGRGFDQRHFDELNPPELTAVLSDAFATVLFGEPRAAVGQKVKVNDVTVTIVGVAPRRFNGAVQSGQPKRIWLPLSSLQLVEKVDLAAYFDPGVEWFEAVARLQPGVDVSDAQSAIRAVAARFDLEAKARGQRTSTATADVVPLRGLIDAARYANERGPTAVIFSVLAALILLVCTTTVNSLLAGAAVARRYEIGVRLALGASRSRVVRQLLTEVSLLSIAGGLLGMWVFATLGRFTEVAKDGFDTSPNWATAAFTLAYAVIAATLAGLSPALHATRAGVSEVLKESSAAATRRTRLQRTFVIAQIAIAQPLMVTLAAATAHVFSRIPTLENVRLRERLLIAELDTQLRYTVNAPDRIPDLMRRLEAVPGVVSVLRVGNGWGESISLERPRETADDSTATSIRAAAFAVPPGYFEVVGAPIARGRGFVASDTTLAVRPVLINRLLAAQLFQSRDPIGQRIRQQTRGDLAPTELEVIGVVDMAQENNSFGYASDDPPIFVPLRRQQGGRILIRTSVPADSLVAAVRSAAKEEARLFPVARIGTLAQADRDRRDSRLQIFGTGAGCASIVLMLASIGLYAMMNIAVGQRRREIGIRVALGAHAHQVVALFFRNGLRVILLGLALGLPLSLAGLAFVTWKSGMPWLHVQRSAVVVTLAVVGVGALASWLPARRAASVNPTLALRSE